MDLRELFLSCRSGDLKRIKYLVEHKEVDLNVRDRYYACLCGHVKLAEYLLDKGARCEAQTFDGERILYGALTNEIRNKLRNYEVISSRVVVRDEYEEFLRKLLDLGDYSDFTIYLQGEEIAVHRFILGARSPYFCEAFQEKWAMKRTVKLQTKLVDLAAFKSIIQYLYSGRLNTLLDDVDECMRLAMQCRLPYLKESLEAARKRATAFGLAAVICAIFYGLETENTEHNAFSTSPLAHGLFCKAIKLPQLEETTYLSKRYVLADNKPGTKIKVLSLESNEFQAEIQRDLGQLAKQAISSGFTINDLSVKNHLPLPNLSDVCFIVARQKFFCHKAAFAGRSEYFKALFRDHFRETSRADFYVESINTRDEDAVKESGIDLMMLRDVTAEVFAQVVYYVYANNAQLTVENVYELLNIGELYLMPGLKKLCANFLISIIDSQDVASLIKVSRTYNLPRIEVFCVEFIAKNLEEVMDSENFHQLILEDAFEVKGRQEMDSIVIIDDLRYHIDILHKNSADAYEKHRMIDRLLQNLNLEA